MTQTQKSNVYEMADYQEATVYRGVCLKCGLGGIYAAWGKEPPALTACQLCDLRTVIPTGVSLW